MRRSALAALFCSLTSLSLTFVGCSSSDEVPGVSADTGLDDTTSDSGLDSSDSAKVDSGADSGSGDSGSGDSGSGDSGSADSGTDSTVTDAAGDTGTRPDATDSAVPDSSSSDTRPDVSSDTSDVGSDVGTTDVGAVCSLPPDKLSVLGFAPAVIAAESGKITAISGDKITIAASIDYVFLWGGPSLPFVVGDTVDLSITAEGWHVLSTAKAAAATYRVPFFLGSDGPFVLTTPPPGFPALKEVADCSYTVGTDCCSIALKKKAIQFGTLTVAQGESKSAGGFTVTNRVLTEAGSCAGKTAVGGVCILDGAGQISVSILQVK